jgi:hypothetical protein
MTVLSGYCTCLTRLWHFSLPWNQVSANQETLTTYDSMTAIGSATPAQLVAFAHATLFWPVLSTLEMTLSKGFVSNFPGLTATTFAEIPAGIICYG